MKKVLFILISAFTLFMCMGCSLNSEKGNVVEISYNEFAQKIKNRESFVIYVGSATCGHCSTFLPTLEKVVEEKELTVYYIDKSKLTTNQSNAVTKKVDLQGTPTLCSIKDGKADTNNNLVGAKDYDTTLKFFKATGHIE